MVVPMGDLHAFECNVFRPRRHAMELTTIYKRVIGLDVHQAKISACALIQQPQTT